MGTHWPDGGYSADVKIWLEVGSRRIGLGGCGPDDIRPRSAVNLPPCRAVLVVSVDGDEQRRDVRLPRGMRAGEKFTPIENSDLPWFKRLVPWRLRRLCNDMKRKARMWKLDRYLRKLDRRDAKREMAGARQ